MQQIRCDYYSDHYVEGKIEEGFLKLTVTEYDAEYERYDNSIYLSKESVLELIKELQDELDNITRNGKSGF